MRETKERVYLECGRKCMNGTKKKRKNEKFQWRVNDSGGWGWKKLERAHLDNF